MFDSSFTPDAKEKEEQIPPLQPNGRGVIWVVLVEITSIGGDFS